LAPGTHALAQTFWPAGQAQFPAVHTSPLAGQSPSLQQLALGMHSVPQTLSPAGQAHEPASALHSSPATGHSAAVQQSPFAMQADVAGQTRLLAAQAQAPFWQVCPAIDAHSESLQQPAAGAQPLPEQSFRPALMR